MAIIDDVTWSVKKVESEGYSKFTMGQIGPKAVRIPKYMSKTNIFLQPQCKLESSIPKGWEHLSLCLVTVFIFYFQKFVFENIKKKQFSYIF